MIRLEEQVRDKDGHGAGSPPDLPDNLTEPGEEEAPAEVVAMAEGQRAIDRTAAYRLPVYGKKQELLDKLGQHDTVVLIGETGSGKTLMMYPMLRDLMRAKGARGILTQPTQKTTRDTAESVRSILDNYQHGETDYFYRGKHRTADDPVMSYTTDGTLLQMLKQHPNLLADGKSGFKGLDYVVVDEAHLRTRNIDLLLSLLQKAQEARRNKPGIKPLKVIITSATLEKVSLQKYLPSDTPLIEVKVRDFDVHDHLLTDGKISLKDHQAQVDLSLYLDETKTEISPGQKMIGAAAELAVAGLLKYTSNDDHILIFMPGEAEVKQTIDLIDRRLKGTPGATATELIPFYAKLTEKEKEAIKENHDKRKIIVATNAAETGLTLQGLKHVIDSGYMRQTVYDPKTGIESLRLVKCAQSSLTQRKGRVGRTAEGDYYALYTDDDLNSRDAYTIPEIRRTDLTDFMLTIKKLAKSGGYDFQSLKFIDNPPDTPDNPHVTQAINTLKAWGALDDKGNLTDQVTDFQDMGELMAALPINADLAHFIALARKYGCVEEACTIAAFLEDKKALDFRPLKDPTLYDSGSDYLSILNIYRRYKEYVADPSQPVPDEFKEAMIMLARIERTRNALLSDLKDYYREKMPAEEAAITIGRITSFKEKGEAVQKETIGRLVTEAFIDKLLIKEEVGYSLARNDQVRVRTPHPTGVTLGSIQPLVGNIRSTEQDNGSLDNIIYPAQSIKLKWLTGVPAAKLEWLGFREGLVKEEKKVPEYDAKNDRVISRRMRVLVANPAIAEEIGADQVFGQAAEDIFLRALANPAQSLFRFPGIVQLIMDNRTAVMDIKDRYRRAGKPDQSPFHPPDEKVVAFYRGRLGDRHVSSLSQLAALTDVDIRIDKNDYLFASR